MSTDANKATLRRLWEEIFNGGNVALIDELVASDYFNHDPIPGESPGSEGLKQFVLYLRSAFPDIHFDIEHLVAEDDKVVTRWQATATHRGEFMGIPPTAITSNLNGMAIHRIENGRIVEGWNNWDALGLLTQLGVMEQSSDES
jgi:steroid delta-isomerase-like uncharacterized protein